MYYKYKVTWYDPREDDELIDEGLVFATSYGQAADAIVEDYKEDNVINIYLYNVCTEGEGRCINREEINLAFKD